MKNEQSKFKVGDTIRLTSKAIKELYPENVDATAQIIKIEIRTPSNPLLIISKVLTVGNKIDEGWVEKVPNKKISFSQLKIKD